MHDCDKCDIGFIQLIDLFRKYFPGFLRALFRLMVKQEAEIKNRT